MVLQDIKRLDRVGSVELQCLQPYFSSFITNRIIYSHACRSHICVSIPEPACLQIVQPYLYLSVCPSLSCFPSFERNEVRLMGYLCGPKTYIKAVGDSPRSPRDTPCNRRTLALTSQTSFGRSVGIFRSRTEATEL
jgi:hypothetical protein